MDQANQKQHKHNQNHDYDYILNYVLQNIIDAEVKAFYLAFVLSLCKSTAIRLSNGLFKLIYFINWHQLHLDNSLVLFLDNQHIWRHTYVHHRKRIEQLHSVDPKPQLGH